MHHQKKYIMRVITIRAMRLPPVIAPISSPLIDVSLLVAGDSVGRNRGVTIGAGDGSRSTLGKENAEAAHKPLESPLVSGYTYLRRSP